MGRKYYTNFSQLKLLESVISFSAATIAAG
jgi:hypothetical protein